MSPSQELPAVQKQREMSVTTSSGHVDSQVPPVTSSPSSSSKLQPINRFRNMQKLSDFEVIKKIGQGTFGVVQKAKDRQSGQVVALKQLINHSAKEGFPITALREITILKKLHHVNILKIIGMIHEDPKTASRQDLVSQRGVFYTISPYMSSDLVGLLQNPAINMTQPIIKSLMLQMLQGIEYIHAQKYLHRDIKAANILLDPQGVVKIADFGLARLYHGKTPVKGKGPGGGERNYTALVVTRWYRPPELLLGERKYTTAVDLWGMGCVFGELFTKKPILVGSSDANQAQLIFDLVGPPNKATWPDASLLPNKPDLNIGLTCKRSLEARFEPLMGVGGTDLLSKMLTLDPHQRYNASDALDHEYFRTDPLPVSPSEIPKYEESHEIDKERFKRMRAASSGPASASKMPKIDSRSASQIRTGDRPQPVRPNY